MSYIANRSAKIGVKELKYGDIEDFLESLDLSDKTKHNILSTLHSMFVWISKREQKRIMPDLPQQTFELGMRATISKKQQLEVLEHLRQTAPAKVYLGIKWLCTYIAIRPGEMVKLKEGDIDRANGYLYFPHPKEKKFKAVPILPEDIALLEEFPRAFPSMPFFRHERGISGVTENDPYGIKYFYKWWKKSCSALGIDGVDLYGGTRHSSARALRAFHSPEEIKRATMHTTNKAFERYFQIEAEDLRDIYRSTGTVVKIDNGLTMGNRI
jgi:integrase